MQTHAFTCISSVYICKNINGETSAVKSWYKQTPCRQSVRFTAIISRKNRKSEIRNAGWSIPFSPRMIQLISIYITMRATCSLQMRTMLKKLRRLQSVGKVSTSPLCLHWKSLLGFYTMFINLYREWFYLAYSVENLVFFLFRFFFFLQNCWLISPSGSLTRCSFNFLLAISSERVDVVYL